MYFTRYSNEMKKECMDAFKTNVPDYFTIPEIDEYENWLNIIREQDHYYVVYLENEIVACGGFSYNADNTVSFTWGFVHRNFHKQRIGEQLLTYRLQKIREVYPGIEVVLHTSQHSYTFFEKYGFVTVKFTEHGYAPSMHRYDMVLRP